MNNKSRDHRGLVARFAVVAGVRGAMSVSIAGVSGYSVIFRTLLVIFVFAGLAGCENLRTPMAPKQSFDTKKDIKQLEEEFVQASSIKSYYVLQRDKRETDFPCGYAQPRAPVCLQTNVKDRAGQAIMALPA